MRNLDLSRGDMVMAIRDLDPLGANVRIGMLGVVFEPANWYSDNGGPMVRWLNMGVCNVYPGDIVLINRSLKEFEDQDTGEIFSLPLHRK